ncbi:hypothetical protein GA0115255_114141, partial [Streptomyces sp. Ncost-T6T-2b]
MRVDEAHHILGLRLNVWTAIIVFVLAVVYIVVSAKLRPGREEIVEPDRDTTPGKDADAKDAEAKDAEAKDAEQDADAKKDPLSKDEPGESGKDLTAESTEA